MIGGGRAGTARPAPRSTRRPPSPSSAWPPASAAAPEPPGCAGSGPRRPRRSAPPSGPCGRSRRCAARSWPPAAKSSSHRATSSRSSRSSRIAPSPASMCPAAHSYCWRPPGLTSVRDATPPTHQPADRVPLDAARCCTDTDRAAASAARCDEYVPSCRGRCLPVSVSMPSTRTTHRSRWRRTVGRTCDLPSHGHAL